MLINSGEFSKKGNFSGYNLKGDRIHLFKRQMDALGIKTDADFKPFYVNSVLKTYPARQAVDTDGNLVFNEDGTAKYIPYPDGKFTMTRATATAVFKTEEEFINANISDKLLAGKMQHRLQQEYAALGIESEAELETLIG